MRTPAKKKVVRSPELSSRRRRSPKRAAVIAAAGEEFLERGFSGTSMDRIAEVAGVSKRTVYDHFPSKDDLFAAIAEEALQRVEEMPSHAYDPDAPLRQQLVAIGETFASTLAEKDFMRLSRVLMSHFIVSPEWGDHILAAYARLRRDMIAFFRAGTTDGRMRVTDPEFAAAQFCGLIKEVGYWPELVAGQDPLPARKRKKTVEAAVEVFLAYYKAEDGP